jgi:hypothetical protein
LSLGATTEYDRSDQSQRTSHDAPRTGSRGAQRFATLCNTPFRATRRRNPKATSAARLDPKAADRHALQSKHTYSGSRNPRSCAHQTAWTATWRPRWTHQASPTVGPKSAGGVSDGSVSSVSHTRRLGDEANLDARLTTACSSGCARSRDAGNQFGVTLPKQSLSSGAHLHSKLRRRTRIDFWSRWSSATEAASNHESHTFPPQGRFGQPPL